MKIEIIKNFWQKFWWSKLILIIGGLFLSFTIIGFLSPGGQKSFQKGYEAGKKAGQQSTPTPETLPSPSPSPKTSPIPSPTPIPTQTPTSTPTPSREIVMGSNEKSIEFYKRVEALHKQGKVYGELYTEFESDPIVDVNPDMQSVQLDLKYSSITDSVDETDKKMILSDFKTIKALAEQDKSLIIPEYGTLRLFVLTFIDNNGEGRGDLQQMMIDDEPSWSFW